MAREIEKRVKNAILYKDGTIRVDNVRFSYPHVFVPKEGDKGDLSYSITGLLPKSTHKEAKELIKERILHTQQNDPKLKGVKVAQDKWFLKDGDKSDKPEAAGCFMITAREKKRPSVRGRDGKPLTKEDAEQIYGGCWGNILLRPWGQKNDFGKRINSNLISVQLVKGLDASGRPLPGAEPFGEGRISEDEIDEVWDSYEDEDEDGGFDTDDDEDYDGL